MDEQQFIVLEYDSDPALAAMWLCFGNTVSLLAKFSVFVFISCTHLITHSIIHSYA